MAVNQNEVDGAKSSTVANQDDSSSSSSNESDAVGSRTDARIERIADSIADTMPDVQQHAIDAETAKTAEKLAAWAQYTDRRKRPFDPTLHVTNPDGSPVLSTSGYCKIKKPGESAPNPSSYVKIPESAKTSDQAQSQEPKAKFRTSGVAAANLFITTAMIVGGEDFAPVKDEKSGTDEKDLMESAFADYFESKGYSDIPPGIALTVVLIAYVAPRFTMPRTKTRLQRFKEWLYKKYLNHKLRKEKSAPEKSERREKAE